MAWWSPSFWCCCLSRLAARMPVGAVLVLFCMVNCISYVDRGVIPGAFDGLKMWIHGDLGVEDTDKYLGILQSSFIVGYSVASLVMGHLVHRFPPFKLMALGLALWAIAVAVWCVGGVATGARGS